MAQGAPATTSAEDLQAQRRRIEDERRVVIEQAAQEERRCQERFIVTPCVEDVRARRRESLDRLARDLAVVDGALRQQRAADRLQRLSDKQRAQREAMNRPAPPPRVLNRAEATRPASAASAGSSASAEPTSSRSGNAAKGSTSAPDKVQQRRNKAEHEERVRQAQQRRDEVLQRNARRAAEGRAPAAPLPLPPASDVGR